MQHTKSTIEKRGESMTNYDMDELRRQGKIPEELEKKSDEQKRIYQDYMKLREDKKNDRFDLEEAIQSIWQTEDDLETVLYSIMDATDGPPSEDEIVNMILGIKELHGARMQRLWDIFENFVHSQHDTLWRDIKENQKIHDEEKYDYPHDAVSPQPKTVSTKKFMEALDQMDNGGDDDSNPKPSITENDKITN